MPFMFRKLRDDIACIFERDPAARTAWEVLTCYPGLHAVCIHKLAHWLWTHGLRWLGRLHVALRPLADRHRDPSRRDDRPPRVHRPRHGRGDRRDRRDRRRLHDLSRRDARRHLAGPRRKRHPTLGSGVVVGAGAKVLGRLHRRRRRQDRLERGGGEGGAGRRHGGRHSRHASSRIPSDEAAQSASPPMPWCRTTTTRMPRRSSSSSSTRQELERTVADLQGDAWPAREQPKRPKPTRTSAQSSSSSSLTDSLGFRYT